MSPLLESAVSLDLRDRPGKWHFTILTPVDVPVHEPDYSKLANRMTMNLEPLRRCRIKTAGRKCLIRMKAGNGNWVPVVPGRVKRNYAQQAKRRVAKRLAALGIVELCTRRPASTFDVDGGRMNCTPRLHARLTPLGQQVLATFDLEIANGTEMRWRRLVERHGVAN